MTFFWTLRVYVASLRWQLLAEVQDVIWSIFFLQATHSLMQQVAKPNTVEKFFKDPSSCVNKVTFILMPVKIQTIQSHASWYKIMMIRVLQGISPLHSSTQCYKCSVLLIVLETFGIYWAQCGYVS